MISDLELIEICRIASSNTMSPSFFYDVSVWPLLVLSFLEM